MVFLPVLHVEELQHGQQKGDSQEHHQPHDGELPHAEFKVAESSPGIDVHVLHGTVIKEGVQDSGDHIQHRAPLPETDCHHVKLEKHGVGRPEGQKAAGYRSRFTNQNHGAASFPANVTSV